MREFYNTNFFFSSCSGEEYTESQHISCITNSNVKYTFFWLKKKIGKLEISVFLQLRVTFISAKRNELPIQPIKIFEFWSFWPKVEIIINVSITLR